MMKTIVVAKAANNAIGKDNDLLWRLPDDFRFFKRVTMGNFVIMGRKTFDSLPGMLPNRHFVIVTRQKDYRAPEGHYAVNSLEAAFDLCEVQKEQKQVFIIGGGIIYKDALDKGLVDKMLITEVDVEIDDADTFFPEFNRNEWTEEARDHHPADEKHMYDFDFVTYYKKK